MNEMLGHTMAKVSGEAGGDVMLFTSTDGTEFQFYHPQNCCESVSIEDITGDLSDLVGSPIIMAEEVDNLTLTAEQEARNGDCEQWTFYKFATVKGYVTVRWYGASNGYYSTAVSFTVTPPHGANYSR